MLSKEIKTAIIALLVIAASIWGFSFLKGKNIFHPTDEYYVVFDRVDGLIESGNVMYMGYKVGNITGLEFHPERSKQFRVSIIVDRKLKIPLESVVQIKQVNPLASTADLEITFSDHTLFHEPGDTLASLISKGISDYIAEYQGKLDGILLGIDSVIMSVNQVLGAENQQNIEAAIANLKHALGPGGSLMQTLEHVEGITANLEGNNEKINTTLTNLSDFSAGLDSTDIQTTLAKLNSSVQSVNLILGKIESGEGSMGKLLNDSSLYTNLDSTSYYLSILMKDMQENPKRYVHFSLFGGKEKE